MKISQEKNEVRRALLDELRRQWGQYEWRPRALADNWFQRDFFLDLVIRKWEGDVPGGSFEMTGKRLDWAVAACERAGDEFNGLPPRQLAVEAETPLEALLERHEALLLDFDELWATWRCLTIVDDLETSSGKWGPEVIWAMWSIILGEGHRHPYSLEENSTPREVVEFTKAITQVLAVAFAEDELVAEDMVRTGASLARHGWRKGKKQVRLDDWCDRLVSTLWRYLPERTETLEWAHRDGLASFIGRTFREKILGRKTHFNFEVMGGLPEQIENVQECELIALVNGIGQEVGGSQ